MGVSDELEGALEAVAARRVLLICGRESFVTSGAEALLAPVLQGRVRARYSEFEPNPSVPAVERGLQVVRDTQPDAILTVGGGTALDIGKLIAFFADAPVSLRDWLAGARSPGHQRRPLIAIPTTGGSGAEATPFAAVYLDRRKFSIDDSRIQPDVAILAPVLLRSMPGPLMRCAALDALTQAVESYWSVAATPETREVAREAIRGMFEQLGRVAAGLSPSPEALARYSNLAGTAIARTRTTACHAISYPLTSCFGVAHGHAVALTLPSMLRYVAGCDDMTAHPSLDAAVVRARAEDVARVLGFPSPDAAVVGLERLLDRLGIERRLTRLGCSTQDQLEMVVRVASRNERAGNLPRLLPDASLREILLRLG